MTVKQVIKKAREFGASDIHFSEDIPPVLRKDGQLFPLSEEWILENGRRDLINLIPETLQHAFHEGHDADFSFADDLGCRYRINVFRNMGKISCAIRLLADQIPTIEQLGLPQTLADLVMLPRGLILVTGPTGSGKSTTLAAMIEHANLYRKSHILTIEDPIEYMYQSKNCLIHQREVGQDVGSFSLALRSAMREDPDIILVGEMRDFETISAAITAAETGHLVLSTLHTTGAAKTIDRIIDVFPAEQQEQIRVQLSSVLRAVVTQQLVCKNSGGRKAALEIMLCTSAIANMIREGKTTQIESVMQTSRKEGMILLDRALGMMVYEGEISYEEALAKCVDEVELRRFARL